MNVLTRVKLQDVYVQPGKYDAKFMLDPKQSQGFDSVAVVVRNADGTDICTEYKRWGTKLTLSFLIDERTPDGVVIIEVSMKNKEGSRVERFACWVIK